MKTDQELADLASYVTRTEQLTTRDKVGLALALVGGTGVRPEVGAYLIERFNELKPAEGAARR